MTDFTSLTHSDANTSMMLTILPYVVPEFKNYDYKSSQSSQGYGVNEKCFDC